MPSTAAEPKADAAPGAESPAPLNISDGALDASDDTLFQVTPSTSPASTKADLERELDDLVPFAECKEAFSPMRQPDFTLDVGISLSAFGDDVTINVNMNGFALNLCKDSAACYEGSYATRDAQLLCLDDSSTCSVYEVEDVDDLFEDLENDDVEEIEAQEVAPATLVELEQNQVVHEDVDDFLLLRKDELTMSFAAEYTNQVIESVLKGASYGGDALSCSTPPRMHGSASTCATADAPQAPPRVRLEEAAHAQQAAASPARPASSRSLISSRSRRRIIGGVVRTPAPAETSDAGLASQLPLSAKLSDFNPTSPKVSAPSSMRTVSSQRSSRTSKDKAVAKKRSAAVFRVDVTDEASGSDAGGRSSSLARGYDALGAEIYSLQDRAEPALSNTSRSGRGPEADWTAALGHSTVFTSTQGHAALGRAQSASALALDLGIESEPVQAAGFDPCSPRSASAYSKSFTVRSSSTTSLAFPKTKSLSFTAFPMTSKRQGLLPELPASPTSAGSIAWSMRLAKTGAKRGGLASVF